jgi:outer membrane protein OmpU
MFKQILLGGTALMGVAAMTLPAHAGTVGSKDAMSVTLGGELRFNFGFVDQDVSAGRGRGYSMQVDESEVKIGAKNTADNGLTYGVSIELNAGAADGTAADEAYAFIDSDWGRLELGDNDDASDRMAVHAFNVLVGRAGADGDPTDYINFGGRGISAQGFDSTSDATKATYFSPRFGGFQVGASLTPDSGQSAGAAGQDADNDGDFENVFGLGANWEGKFDDVEILLGVVGEFGDSETATGADTEGEIESIGVGANVTFAGFGFGAFYADLAEKGLSQAQRTAGRDAGTYYDLGVSYKTGPWGVSLGYFSSTVSNGTGIADSDIEIYSLDVAYDVAPGWEVTGALHFGEADNLNGTAVPVKNDGTALIFSNIFKF